MRTVLNIIWLILSGLWLAIGYAIAGIVMFILIVTIPSGIQAFKLAGYALWPFGRTVVKRADAGGASVLGNVLWCSRGGGWPWATSRLPTTRRHDHRLSARGSKRQTDPGGSMALRPGDR